MNDHLELTVIGHWEMLVETLSFKIEITLIFLFFFFKQWQHFIVRYVCLCMFLYISFISIRKNDE